MSKKFWTDDRIREAHALYVSSGKSLKDVARQLCGAPPSAMLAGFKRLHLPVRAAIHPRKGPQEKPIAREHQCVTLNSVCLLCERVVAL